MEVEHDVIFGKGGGRDLCCDIYRPFIANGAGMLLLHAGSWRRGDKSSMAGQAEMLTACGYTCVASEYRMVQESPWPAQLHDVKTGLRWLRANAREIGVDAKRIGVLGNSAGGHLALMLAGTPGQPKFTGDGGYHLVTENVAACVAFYPATLFYLNEPCRGGILATRLLSAVGDIDTLQEVSPVSHANKEFPPTFMLHGTSDEVVPYDASVCMYEALSECGVLVELHLQAGRPHAYATRNPEIIQPAMAEVLGFLDRFLMG